VVCAGACARIVARNCQFSHHVAKQFRRSCVHAFVRSADALAQTVTIFGCSLGRPAPQSWPRGSVQRQRWRRATRSRRAATQAPARQEVGWRLTRLHERPRGIRDQRRRLHGLETSGSEGSDCAFNRRNWPSIFGAEPAGFGVLKRADSGRAAGVGTAQARLRFRRARTP